MACSSTILWIIKLQKYNSAVAKLQERNKISNLLQRDYTWLTGCICGWISGKLWYHKLVEHQTCERAVSNHAKVNIHANSNPFSLKVTSNISNFRSLQTPFLSMRFNLFGSYTVKNKWWNLWQIVNVTANS